MTKDQSEHDLPKAVYLARYEQLPEGNVLLTDTQRAIHYRARLIEYLLTIPRFRNIIERDLREDKWRPLGIDSKEWRVVPIDSPYAQAVYTFVGDQLRLREGRAPSPYFMEAIHNLVVEKSNYLPAVFHWREVLHGHLRIEVDTLGKADLFTGTTVEGGQISEAHRVVSSHLGVFQSWDDLRRQAHDDIDSLIDTMQRQFAEDMDGRIAKADQASKIRDLSASLADLVAVLWLRQKPSSFRRDTRRRILEAMGLDKA